MSVRGASLAIVLLLVLATAACEELNNSLVTDVGTVGFVLTEPGLSSQVVNSGVPEQTIQNVQWKLTAPADLTRDDNGAKVDLLFGEPCAFVQTTKSSYNPEGRCAGGIILGSSDDLGSTTPADVPVTLDMTVNWMEVRRAVPTELPDGADFDADGVNNETDNCILLPNPDQTDSNADGVGDVCSVRDFFGNTVADNDGDGVADGSDNCVWIQNPLQEDTTGIAEEYGIPDGIGDACTEQRATVTGQIPDLNREFLLALATGGLSFVTVDFDVTCNWAAGTCVLANEDAVQVCGTETVIAMALAGCSDEEETDP